VAAGAGGIFRAHHNVAGKVADVRQEFEFVVTAARAFVVELSGVVSVIWVPLTAAIASFSSCGW